jgi:muramoyltetrapeptide carboxypeptidase
METIKIQRVSPGDCIGFFSSSSPTSPRRLAKIEETFAERGYRVKFGKNILRSDGYVAGTAAERTADFNDLLLDDDVKLIVTAKGGKGAGQMLPLIDFDLVKQARKGIVGLSDPAILLNAITGKTGLITIHGPNGFNFGSQLSGYTARNWWSFIEKPIGPGDKFDLIPDAVTVRPGIATGRLLGGHLRTIRNLIGTPWEPDWTGAILAIEDVGTRYCDIDAMLTYLDYTGVLGNIAGLIVGQLADCPPENSVETIEQIVMRNCANYDFPILSNVLIGHTDDKLTLPIGAEVILDSDQKTLTLAEAVFE